MVTLRNRQSIANGRQRRRRFETYSYLKLSAGKLKNLEKVLLLVILSVVEISKKDTNKYNLQ